jgi:REP element-mobilizing transposase RayT
MSKQLSLRYPVRGGKRRGSGRKPKGTHALVSHLARPRFHAPTPVHVTLRIADAIPSLRSARRFAKIKECFARSRGRFGVRLVEYSVLGNHLHMVVEAEDSVSLSRGMQGLCIRLARALNRMLARHGRVFADHFHSRLLRTPTELCGVIRYLRGNAEHHYGERGVDACSSGARDSATLLVPPHGWLLRIGWQRARNAMAPATFGML